MYLKSLVLFRMICTCCALTDISGCPPGPVWQRRANLFCEVKEEYHCLYDSFNSNKTNVIHAEKCFPSLNYKGKRYVLSGYLNAVDCQTDRFSPYPIRSNVNTEAVCPLKKSLCNEEGQITVANGSSSLDRVCRCNFEKGYNFINSPSDPCNCQPFKEDCSCYKDKCMETEGRICLQPFKTDISCKPFLPEARDTYIDIKKLESDVSSDPNLFELTNKTSCIILIFIVTAAIMALIALLVKQGNTCYDPSILCSKDKIEPNIDLSCRIPDIYREEMFVVEYYVETKELDLIKDTFQGKHRKQLAILLGIHGCGKTQTAHEFCKRSISKYSIVAKLEFDPNVSFVETLERFAKAINLEISHEERLKSETIIGNIKKYLKERSCLPCLLFLDNVGVKIKSQYKDIRCFIQLREELQKLDIIVATTDRTFSTVFKHEQRDLIEFKGMDKQEYMKLFRDVEKNERDIENFVNIVGCIPFVLATAVRYMKTKKTTPSTYIEEFRSNADYIFEEINDFDSEAYDVDLKKSQTTSLNYIKEKFMDDDPKIWEILKYLPFLCFGSISEIVLQALYYHKSGCFWNEKKKAVDLAITKLSQFCLCHIKPEELPLIPKLTQDSRSTRKTNESKQVEKTHQIMSFHEVTIWALNAIVMKDSNSADKGKHFLLFLLKMFCFEIDIDARTDITVARNLQFIRHAKKVLKTLEKEKFVFKGCRSTELKFCQSYLHCAIGSTMLFQRTQIYKAHLHLMKARRIGLLLVDDKSVFDKDICTFQKKGVEGTKKPDIDEIKVVASKVYHESAHLISEDFVKEFVTGKRRNQNDVDVVKTKYQLPLDLYESHYLSQKDYAKLVDCKLAFDIGSISKLMLAELILRILHNNSRALNELTYIVTKNQEDSEFQLLQKACFVEVETSRIFCKAIGYLKYNDHHFKDETQLFSCLESDRSGTMLMRWYQLNLEPETLNVQCELESDVRYFEDMINNPPDTCNDFGVVKISDKTNIRHIAMCHRILLRYQMKIYDKETNEKRKLRVYGKCLDVIQKIKGELDEMEHDTSRYCWLSLPLLYIQCGKCLLMTETQDSEGALQYFEKAINFEISRKAFSTRFTIEGYEGKIECLLNLGEVQKALSVIDEVIANNKGRNRDNVVQKFKDKRKLIEVTYLDT